MISNWDGEYQEQGPRAAAPMRTRGRVFAWRGWISAALLGPPVLLALLSPPRIDEGGLADGLLDLVGWLLLGFGGGMRLWSMMYIAGRKDEQLITSGPYALVRNPLYVGSGLILLALCAFMKSAVVTVAALTVLALHALVIVPSEEAHLRAIFGGRFEAFMRHVPRFLPKGLGGADFGMTLVKVGPILREYARVYGCVCLAAALEFVQRHRVCGHWPLPARMW